MAGSEPQHAVSLDHAQHACRVWCVTFACMRRRMKVYFHPLRSNRTLCPDPQLAVCCFCGTEKTRYHRKKDAWRAVVRKDVQHA